MRCWRRAAKWSAAVAVACGAVAGLAICGRTRGAKHLAKLNDHFRTQRCRPRKCLAKLNKRFPISAGPDPERLEKINEITCRDSARVNELQGIVKQPLKFLASIWFALSFTIYVFHLE